MPLLRPLALLFTLFLLATSALAQDNKPAIQKYNYAEWTKGIFSEATTATVGGAKFIYLAGIGAEDENGPRGKIRNPGDFIEQCKYAYDKIKRALAANGAQLSDVVKPVGWVEPLRNPSTVGASYDGFASLDPSYVLFAPPSSILPEVFASIERGGRIVEIGA